MSNVTEIPKASGYISIERSDGKRFDTKNVSVVTGNIFSGTLEDESFSVSLIYKSPAGTYRYPDNKNNLSAHFIKSNQTSPPVPPTEFDISEGSLTLEVASPEQMKGSLNMTLKSSTGELLTLTGNFDISV